MEGKGKVKLKKEEKDAHKESMQKIMNGKEMKRDE